MKKLIAVLTLALVSQAQAHDEGHGPKLTGVGNYGGIISAVVAKADASKGAKADMVYRAELVRSEKGGVQVYLYKKDLNADSKPEALDLKDFDKKATAVMAAEAGGKMKTVPFALNQKTLDSGKMAFVGAPPKPPGLPYNIDVTLKEKGKELLTAFDGLD